MIGQGGIVRALSISERELILILAGGGKNRLEKWTTRKYRGRNGQNNSLETKVAPLPHGLVPAGSSQQTKIQIPCL